MGETSYGTTLNADQTNYHTRNKPEIINERQTNKTYVTDVVTRRCRTDGSSDDSSKQKNIGES